MNVILINFISGSVSPLFFKNAVVTGVHSDGRMFLVNTVTILMMTRVKMKRFERPSSQDAQAATSERSYSGCLNCLKAAQRAPDMELS